MKQIFEIKDKKIIKQVLDSVEFGTLAICFDDKPYSLPLNFVELNDKIYFHGSKQGRKIDILKNNKLASFSVVKSYSLIPSYFSSNDALACPATQFFKSVIVDGRIEFVEEYDEKVEALSALMKKLQKEGGYKPLDEEIYKKSVNATIVYKLIPKNIKAKFKFAQHLNQERFDMIVKHLELRGSKKDILTAEMMKELYKK
jgi:nitroimidazol reductase NimA-like FMN-containing flavoprotein (pyridoxamine 5'-phosphate oxidase superfamily)